MKLTLPENSLFAILLRSRWWVSLLIALGAFGVVRLVLNEGYAFFAALPFIVIAVMALWRQRGVPSGARLDAAACVYVLAGEMTQNALGFAKKTKINWVRGADLVKLVSGRGRQ